MGRCTRFVLLTCLSVVAGTRQEDHGGNQADDPPKDSLGNEIPQELAHQAEQGKSIGLEGDWWESQVVSSTEKAKVLPETVAMVIIDMQPLFYDKSSPWGDPENGLEGTVMKDLWPKQKELAAKIREYTNAADSIYLTKYVTPRKRTDSKGIMQHYYEKEGVTQNDLGTDYPNLIGIMPQLQDLVETGAVVSTKTTAGAFGPSSALPTQLELYWKKRGVAETETKTIIVTGVETDYCVLATVLGMVDHNYHIIVVSDGIGSSQKHGHQAQLDYTFRRFDHMVDIGTTAEVISMLEAKMAAAGASVTEEKVVSKHEVQ